MSVLDNDDMTTSLANGMMQHVTQRKCEYRGEEVGMRDGSYMHDLSRMGRIHEELFDNGAFTCVVDDVFPAREKVRSGGR